LTSKRHQRFWFHAYTWWLGTNTHVRSISRRPTPHCTPTAKTGREALYWPSSEGSAEPWSGGTRNFAYPGVPSPRLIVSLCLRTLPFPPLFLPQTLFVPISEKCYSTYGFVATFPFIHPPLLLSNAHHHLSPYPCLLYYPTQNAPEHVDTSSSTVDTSTVTSDSHVQAELTTRSQVDGS